MTPAEAFAAYRARARDAVERNLHHDQRRAYLFELLREGFGVEAEDVVLEHNVKLLHTRGRIDLLYRQIVFEVKRDLEKEREDVLRELELYLRHVGDNGIALATDGLRFEVYRIGSDGVHLFDAFDATGLDDMTAAAWLDSYLFTQSAVTPTADDVVRRFGPKSSVFLAAEAELRQLWKTVAGDAAVEVKRDEWDRLLRMVYGSQKGSDDLFIRHTYLALVARLFAYLAITLRLPQPGTELQVVTGEAFRKEGIENLVEEDFFTWLASPNLAGPARGLVAGLARHLSVYATEKVDEDLLKELYETLVDPIDRHDLGEYYTPDWLADLLLETAGYEPGMRLLDPACGSGTFLFTAIRRLRAHGLAGADLVTEAEKNVMGLDVHPLAVTVARANFVLALRQDAIASGRGLRVPVWMADSLAVPEASFGRPIEVVIPPPRDMETPSRQRFLLPTEMEDVRPGALSDVVALLAEYGDPELAEGDAVEGLGSGLRQLGVAEFESAWRENLDLLRKLVEEGRNTVWTFVLSNAARPQAIARKPVDIVVGNPPWLALRDIADGHYRGRLTDLALEYGLLASRRGWQAGALELATVFLCFSADHYLRPGGQIAFVLPRSVLFGAKQHEPFRRLAINVNLTPEDAFDLEGVDPLFRVPSCAAVLRKERATKRPWLVQAVSGTLPRRNASRRERDVALNVGEPRLAEPDEARYSTYLDRAFQGATIAPRPFWFVHARSPVHGKRVWVETDEQAASRAKHPWTGLRLEGELESDFLFATFLAIYPFRLGPLKLCALPVELNGSPQILSPVEVLRRGAPGMHRWLTRAEQIWQERKKDSASQNVPLQEYLDNHGNLRRQRPGGVRLVYGADGSHVRAAVVDTDEAARVAGGRALLFDMNMYSIAVRTADEAHYLAAVLNTPLVDAAIKGGQTRGAWGARHIHRRPFEVLPIPEFDPFDERHARLAQLSRAAHDKLKDLPYVRTWKQQLGPVTSEVAEGDSLARQVCSAGSDSSGRLA